MDADPTWIAENFNLAIALCQKRQGGTQQAPLMPKTSTLQKASSVGSVPVVRHKANAFKWLADLENRKYFFNGYLNVDGGIPMNNFPNL